MELITSERRDALLDTFERDAFHLELQDSYHVADEDDPFTRWRQGQPDDFAWFRPWLDRIHTATRAGKTVRRVRVVTEPVTDYIRWEHSITRLNQDAGEDIRWLPRHLVPDGVSYPAGGNDWWLFDDKLLAVGHRDDDQRIKGTELVTDPAVVAECTQLRDQLWSLATPHDQYVPA